MDVTAVTESVKKKLTNSCAKRSYSLTQLIDHCPSKRQTKKINTQDYFLHQRIYSDVKIQLNNQIIWCDKAFLAAASPILCQQLSQLKSNENLLIYEDIHLDEFLLFLEFIYPIFNPEINQHNISFLAKLAHRFQFNILEHACQLYIIQYLNTIRCVSRQSQTSEDYFLINSYNHNKNSESIGNQSDLIEFHDGKCVYATNIILDLCQWLEIYFFKNIIVRQSIMNILEQISVNNLNLTLNIIDLSDHIKGYIFKQRAEYLQSINGINRSE